VVSRLELNTLYYIRKGKSVESKLRIKALYRSIGKSFIKCKKFKYAIKRYKRVIKKIGKRCMIKRYFRLYGYFKISKKVFSIWRDLRTNRLKGKRLRSFKNVIRYINYTFKLRRLYKRKYKNRGKCKKKYGRKRLKRMRLRMLKCIIVNKKKLLKFKKCGLLNYKWWSVLRLIGVYQVEDIKIVKNKKEGNIWIY